MNRTVLRLLSMSIVVLLLLSVMPTMLPEIASSEKSETLPTSPGNAPDSFMDSEFNLTNDYQKFWEPNNIRGSSHAVVVSDDKQWMVIGGGYVNDAELHLYRWSDDAHEYIHVWDVGDGIITGDIFDLDLMDCDNNGRFEILAGCSDGRILVFEQIYDASPTFIENDPGYRFALVWDSGTFLSQQIWSIMAYDIDHDSHEEIIAGCWDNKVYVFDYIDHSAWPYCQEEHWIEFAYVWDSGDVMPDRVNAIAVADSDGDLRNEVVAGCQDGKVYVFEELACLHHEYELTWNSSDAMFMPVNSLTASPGLDDDDNWEIVASAYGQGVFVFDYVDEWDDYRTIKMNRAVASWELGSLLTSGVYTGFEVDPYIDMKTFGWEYQGIYENDLGSVPYPWNNPYIGGASALGGPIDNLETTFDSSETYLPVSFWDFEYGNETGELMNPLDVAISSNGTIYITDYNADRVQIFDYNMNPISSFGTTGTGPGEFNDPMGVTVDPDGYVYVADWANSRIQKFNSTGHFVDMWGQFGSENGNFSGPWYLYADLDGLLYISDTGNDRIQILNYTDGSFVDAFGISGSSSGQFLTPAGITVGPDDNIYVADNGNNRIQKFAKNGTYLDEFSASSGMYGLDVDNDGFIYSVDFGTQNLYKYTKDGTLVFQTGASGSTPGKLSHPTSVTVYPDGGVLVVSYQPGNIQRLAVPEYELLSVIDDVPYSGGLWFPFDIAVGPDGSRYVTEIGNSEIYKFDSDGIYLMNWSIPTNSWPMGIDVDPAGNVYVTAGLDDKVYKYDSNGNLTLEMGETGTGPGQLASPIDVVYHNGSIYVSEYVNDRISVFNATTGDYIFRFGATGSGLGDLQQPYGMDIGPDNLLYVSDRGNVRIQRFFTNGTPINFWSVSGIDPVFLTYGPLGEIYVAGANAYQINRYTPDGYLLNEIKGGIANTTVSLDEEIAGWGITFDHEENLLVCDAAGHFVANIRPYFAQHNVSYAIVDVGRYEEWGGNSLDTLDLAIAFENEPDLDNLEIKLSNDLINFYPIERDQILDKWYLPWPTSGYRWFVVINVDETMNDNWMTEYRYFSIGVRGGQVLEVDGAFGYVVRPIDTALVVTTGQIKKNDGPLGYEEIIMGTVDGQIMAYSMGGVLYWESASDFPRFSMDTSIRDIVQIDSRGHMPTYYLEQHMVDEFDVISAYPAFERFLSYTLVQIDGTSALDLVATIYESGHSRLLYFRNYGTDAVPSFSFINNFFDTRLSIGTDYFAGYASVTVGKMDYDNDVDIVIGQRSFIVDVGYVSEVRYFEQTSSLYWAERTNYLSSVQSWVNKEPWMPRVSMCDFDGDGDTDLIVGQDKLYYFEHTGYFGGSGFSYLLHSDFFDDINDEFDQGEIAGKVAISDYDLDGDTDITVSHSFENYTHGGMNPRTSYLTYFENTGTNYNPVWVKQRSMYEPDFRGSTGDYKGSADPQLFDFNSDGILDLYIWQEDEIDRFYGRLDHDVFIVATYPTVHMVEVEKRMSNYFGYEAYDSWDNSIIMNEWSKSLEYGDVDQDGIPEVFVGSFDNNIIAFEQVANNTYRRSWRSPDFMLLNDLGYETGEYLDIRDMVIGDQDRDGKEEIIIACGYELIVFEVVENNFYELVWRSGLIRTWQIAFTHFSGWIYHHANIVQVGDDLDKDGYREIILGADRNLYVFECVGDNNYTVVYEDVMDVVEGGYGMIYDINTGDVDKDGLREIVFVGTDEMYNGAGEVTYADGWIRVHEVQKNASSGRPIDNGYAEVLWDYDLYNMGNFNPGAYSLDIAYHATSDYPTVFAGHSFGVALFETDGDNSLVRKANYLTDNVTRVVKADNTDGDSWMEFIAGSGNFIFVFEQNQTKNPIDNIYDQVWLSKELDEYVTDLRIGDSNRNGRKEILATSLMGYLYGFEWIANVTASETASLSSVSVSMPSEGQSLNPWCCDLPPNRKWSIFQRRNEI